MSKLPTAEETYVKWFGSDLHTTRRSIVKNNIISAIESHTATHTEALREENTRYRQALESIAQRWNKAAEHNDMRTALHLIQQDVFDALKNNEG